MADYFERAHGAYAVALDAKLAASADIKMAQERLSAIDGGKWALVWETPAHELPPIEAVAARAALDGAKARELNAQKRLDAAALELRQAAARKERTDTPAAVLDGIERLGWRRKWERDKRRAARPLAIERLFHALFRGGRRQAE